MGDNMIDGSEFSVGNFIEWCDQADGLGELEYLKETTSPWGPVSAVKNSSYNYGDGNEMGFVVKVADKYLLISGWYSSWDGSDFDKVTEVEPVTVTSTVFKNIKTGNVYPFPVIVN